MRGFPLSSIITCASRLWLLILLAGAAWSYEGAATQAGLASLQGQVSVRHGAGSWFPARVGTLLQPGDSVKTGKGAFAVVLLDNLTSLRLGQSSELKIITYAEGELSSGKSWVNANPGKVQTTTFELKGPNAVAAVKGTSFEMAVQGGQAQVRVWEGTVSCRSGGAATDVGPGKSYRAGKLLAAGGPPDAWQRWNLDCDRELAQEAVAVLTPASAVKSAPQGGVVENEVGGSPATGRPRPLPKPKLKKKLTAGYLAGLGKRLGAPKQ